MKIVKTIVPAASIALIAACGSSKTTQAPPPEQQAEATISFQAALPPADFSGNSVRICGVRGTFSGMDANGNATDANENPADAKYRCFNNLNDALGVSTVEPPGMPPFASGTPSGMDCPCFTFNPDGSLMGVFPDANPETSMSDAVDLPTNSAGSFIPNLCPSENVSANGGMTPQDWSFVYQIYASGNCSGDVLNNGNNTNNFFCTSAANLNTQESPNQSIEPLVPGQNTNNIVCTTVNARKGFDFTACALSCGTAASGGATASVNDPVQQGTPPAGPRNCVAPDLNVFECGCTATGTGNACECANNLALPTGCHFQALTGTDEPCAIVCPPPSSLPPRVAPGSAPETQAFLLSSCNAFCNMTSAITEGVGGALPTCASTTPPTTPTPVNFDGTDCVAGTVAGMAPDQDFSGCMLDGLALGQFMFPSGCHFASDTGNLCVVQCNPL